MREYNTEGMSLREYDALVLGVCGDGATEYTDLDEHYAMGAAALGGLMAMAEAIRTRPRCANCQGNGFKFDPKYPCTWCSVPILPDDLPY
jgi:hypothetical protein